MRGLEDVVERVIVGSRFLLLFVIIGLAATLALFAAQFLYHLGSIAIRFPAQGKAPVIVAVLELIDMALIAGLIFTVAVSLYDHFIRRLVLPGERGRVAWLAHLDAGTLKVTVASSIAAISLVHVLQVHLNSEQYSGETLLWKVVIHIVLIASAVSLAFIDRLTGRAAVDVGRRAEDGKA